MSSAFRSSAHPYCGHSRIRPPALEGGGITEIVLPSSASAAIVLPMLAHLSHQGGGKWLTWIVTRGMSREFLLSRGFALSALRLVYSSCDEQTLWLLHEALSVGNSHTVAALCDNYESREIKKLEQAAYNGVTQGLLLQHRQTW